MPPVMTQSVVSVRSRKKNKDQFAVNSRVCQWQCWTGMAQTRGYNGMAWHAPMNPVDWRQCIYDTEWGDTGHMSFQTIIGLILEEEVKGHHCMQKECAGDVKWWWRWPWWAVTTDSEHVRLSASLSKDNCSPLFAKAVADHRAMARPPF